MIRLSLHSILLVLGGLFFLAAVLYAVHSATPPAPSLSPPAAPPEERRLFAVPDSLDFGHCHDHETPRQTVTLENTGAAPLVLAPPRVTCPCIAAQTGEGVLAPGEETSLEVSLHFEGYGSNTVEGAVYLLADDPPEILAQIAVVATLEPEYELDPPRLDFDTGPAGRPRTRTLSLRQLGSHPLEIRRLEVPPPFIADVQILSENPAEYAIEVTLASEARPGSLRRQLELTTNAPRIPRVTVPLYGEVLGFDPVFTPAVVVFGPAAPGETLAPLEVTTAMPARISAVSTTIEGLVVDEVTSGEDMRHVLGLSLVEGQVSGDYTGSIRIRLESGGHAEEHVVRAFGTIDE